MEFQSIGYQKWLSNLWTALPRLKAGGMLPILPLIMCHVWPLLCTLHVRGSPLCLLKSLLPCLVCLASNSENFSIVKTIENRCVLILANFYYKIDGPPKKKKLMCMLCPLSTATLQQTAHGCVDICLVPLVCCLCLLPLTWPIAFPMFLRYT